MIILFSQERLLEEGRVERERLEGKVEDQESKIKQITRDNDRYRTQTPKILEVRFTWNVEVRCHLTFSILGSIFIPRIIEERMYCDLFYFFVKLYILIILHLSVFYCLLTIKLVIFNHCI